MTRMTREEKWHLIIVEGLRRKTCSCRWIFVSRNHDRFRLTPDCKQFRCAARDFVLAAINTA